MTVIPINNRLEIDIEKPQTEISPIIQNAAKLVKICVTAYPNSDKFPNEEAIANTVISWANYFADDDWRVVGLALKKHIATSKWVPSIAEIRELLVEITRPDLVPPDEAWNIVNNWISATSEYSDEDLYLMFPKVMADAILACGGKAGLYALRREQHHHNKAGLDKLTFMQLYEPRYQREKQAAMVPASTLSDIAFMQEHLDNPEYQKLKHTHQYIEDKAKVRKKILEIDIGSEYS